MPYLKVNNINLFYESTGEGAPVLFLHGLGSGTRDWEWQVPYFARFYRVITVDARGHGQSDKPAEPYSVPLFAADIVAFIRALNVAPVHLVGISMGGMIALQIGADAPELLKSLVVVNSNPALRIQTPKEKLMLWQRLLIVQVLGMRRMGVFLGKRLFPQPEQADLRQIFADRWAENDKRAYLNALRGLVNWDVTDRLPQITCPVLVVAAENDYTPLAEKRAYTAKLPRAELVVVPEAHHATPAEKPDAFNEIVHAFLKQHP